jgi:hypothetical protein
VNANIYLRSLKFDANKSWTTKKPKQALTKHTQHKILGHYAHLQNSTHDQITISNQEYCCCVIQHIAYPKFKKLFQESITCGH